MEAKETKEIMARVVMAMETTVVTKITEVILIRMEPAPST